MKIKTLIFVFVFLAITIALVSCTKKILEPKGKELPKAMQPTKEYDYMLTPKYWDEQFAQVSDVAKMGKVKTDFDTMLKQGGYDKPKISGQTDGENILLSGKYPALKDEKDITEIFAKLPAGKAGFPGRIPSDKLIAYLKLPGLQPIVDTVHDYYQYIIDKGESTSQSNPVTQMIGLMMMVNIDIQEDVFSWMGPEMGFIMYKAVDPDKKEYLNTAFAMSIKDKAKAGEKINKILNLTASFSGQKAKKEMLTREKYKSFDMDVLDTSALNLPPMGFMGEEKKAVGKMNGGVLYTDDYIFISDTYGLKQLADIYNPGGAPGEASTMEAYVDWDASMKYSSRYQEESVNEMRKQLKDNPELLKKFEDSFNEFTKMSKEKALGKSKMLMKVNPDGFQIDIETTKSVIELVNFMNKTIMEMMKTEEEKPGSTSEKKEEQV